MDPATIWTIGHSTRPIEELLGLLAEHRIEVLADVRRFPTLSYDGGQDRLT